MVKTDNDRCNISAVNHWQKKFLPDLNLPLWATKHALLYKPWEYYLNSLNLLTMLIFSYHLGYWKVIGSKWTCINSIRKQHLSNKFYNPRCSAFNWKGRKLMFLELTCIPLFIRLQLRKPFYGDKHISLEDLLFSLSYI